ncbi:MAG: hypothetical protein WC702_00675 [Patescibacteria group bacterium]|jgi:hypothetical protein
MWFKRQKGRRNFFRKVQTEPYQARRFKNPYFQQVSKKSKWPFAIAGIVLGLTIALFSFFFTAPIFTITSVRVEGAETINPKEIRTIVEDHLNSSAFLIFKKNNRFLSDKDEIKEKLEKDYSFSSLEIKREGHTLAVILKEKVSSFLWQSGGVSYLLDNTGAVIRTTLPEETTSIMNPPLLYGATKDGSLMPELIKILVFKDLADKPVEIGQVALTENEVKNIRSFFDAMLASGISIEAFELNRDVGTWFKAVTRNGYDILLDPDGDILKQADSVLIILREQIKDPSVLEYIDVRFGDHVYYK